MRIVDHPTNNLLPRPPAERGLALRAPHLVTAIRFLDPHIALWTGLAGAQDQSHCIPIILVTFVREVPLFPHGEAVLAAPLFAHGAVVGMVKEPSAIGAGAGHRELFRHLGRGRCGLVVWLADDVPVLVDSGWGNVSRGDPRQVLQLDPHSHLLDPEVINLLLQSPHPISTNRDLHGNVMVPCRGVGALLEADKIGLFPRDEDLPPVLLIVTQPPMSGELLVDVLGVPGGTTVHTVGVLRAAEQVLLDALHTLLSWTVRTGDGLAENLSVGLTADRALVWVH